MPPPAGTRDTWLHREATAGQCLSLAEPGGHLEKPGLAPGDGVCGRGVCVIVGRYQILDSGCVWIWRGSWRGTEGASAVSVMLNLLK